VKDLPLVIPKASGSELGWELASELASRFRSHYHRYRHFHIRCHYRCLLEKGWDSGFGLVPDWEPEQVMVSPKVQETRQQLHRR
jgi:hypothetical protein